jgi:signal transduction histidine kinase
MRVTRGVRLALGVAALAVGGAESALILSETRAAFTETELVVSLLAGWSFIGSGLVAWTRRPAHRTGPLLIAVGLTFFAGLLNAADPEILHDLGAWVRPLHLAFFTWVLLAFPSGRLDSTLARGLVVAVFVDLVVLYHAPLAIGDDGVGETLGDVSYALGSVLFLAAALLLLVRWAAGSDAWRRAVAWVLWPGALALALLSFFNASTYFSDPVGSVPMWAFRIAFAAIPIAFLVVLLRVRLARASVAELVVALETTHAPGALRDALARTLGDPSLDVAYWLSSERRYVDIEGRPLELPREGERRVATLVERDGGRVAAIIHDEALSAEPELLRAVSAAAALALENERLQAELRAHLDELKASRARIVEAADLERKRIERNLHDGTQQRLTSVTLALGLVESRLTSDPVAARTSLVQAREVLAAALAELRDLSQGIHPNVLTEGGLGPALEDLVYAAPAPVTLAADVNGRLAELVEAGAYYVIAEALANIAKHAQASTATVRVRRENGRLVLSVLDDGVGGADLSRGSGLRGLADRVQALGGTFEVESASGHGTEVRARIPCA